MARPIATRWRWPPERLAGLAVEVLGEVEDASRLVDLLVDGGLRGLGQLERERHVLPHRQVRIGA